MKRGKDTPLTGARWDGNRWRRRCAWCSRIVRKDDPVFAISVRMHAIAERELEPGHLAPLLLAKLGRVVPMMIPGLDSEARRQGKGGVFKLCSEACAGELQRALRDELDSVGDVPGPDQGR